MSLLPNLDQMTDNEKLAVLESIQKSIAESKEIQKKKIGENVDLVVQALKKIESDIRDRFDAVGNSIEKRVLSIQDGRDGANGTDGRNGKDGKSGRDGLKGDRGVDGQAGRDGVDGVDGISVVNAQIDFDGSLVITLSDGRELNVGEVVSQDIAEKIKVISTMSTNGAVGIKDEGSSISTGVKNINFVGATVTATNSGDDVTVNVSAGTGTVTSVAATGGTGISVSGSPITTTGTLTITNTAPDQTVVLTAGTGISTSGTYPSFTVTNSAPDQTVALTQSGTTTITGTYPNFTISSADQFQGTVTSVAATVPAFLSITGSPVTTSGTLAIGLSGTALPVLNGGTGVTTSTGSGNNVLSTSPTLVTPILGTPQSGTVTNLTGTASININGTVGATTANTGAFTTLSATGVTTVQAGTAALPAITTTGDTNTGIFFPAADTIAFTEGGAESMRIDSSGNVGIGTTSTAGYALAIQRTGDNALMKVTAVTAGGAGIDLINSGGSELSYVGASGNNVLAFRTGGTERMRIDSSGNLLVGVTSANANGGVLQLKSGITFPATQVAATDANTLDDYEEGEWTPTDASGAALTITPSNGKYTKIGRVVYFQFKVTYPTTANTANAIIGGLPFTVNNNDRDNIPVNVLSSGTAVSGMVNQNDTTFNIYTIGTFTTVTNATLSTRTLRGSGWYVAA